ncbi:MAG: hypothetical protein ACRCZO_12330 [Cetobacterium sp.]|uniref:hypothetical protein n=1 Tax=Cetobacterium sp. TaxID=2071632 RepID=UPI003EE7B0DA
MTPPKNEDDFKKLLNKYEMDSSLNQAPGRVSQEVFWMYIDDIIVGIIKNCKKRIRNFKIKRS